MAIDINSIEGQAIRKFIPLATLPSLHFEALCTELFIERANKGSYLFKKGDNDEELFYLLNGEINLQANGLVIETIKAGSVAAQFAIAHQNPRQIDAVARTSVRYIRIKREFLDKPPTVYVEPETSYVVAEDNEITEDDWMSMLLGIPLFRHLSPQNLQQVLLAFEEVDSKKGSRIIDQGDEGNYFYLIRQGYCQLSRKPSAKAREILFAKLRRKDTFGEDALIADEPNNFSVKAMTDCSLLRLSKENFLELIKKPSQQFIDYEQVLTQQQSGAQLIDVRLPDDYKVKHLEGSINMPYFSLRMQMKNLDREQKVVVICDDGKISEAAAFLLFKYNFEALILQGGINAIKQDINKPSATFDIDDGIGFILNHEDISQTQPSRQDIEPLQDSENSGDAAPPEPEPAAAEPEIPEISLDIGQIEAYEESLAEQVEKLTEENKQLKQIVRKLHRQCKKLLEEKSTLEKQLGTALKQKSKTQKNQAL